MKRDLPGLLAASCLVPLCGIVVWLAGRPLATDDAWWHLALGAVYARDGLWIDADPLLHTAPGQPTVPHEWLFQVALHAIQRAVGFPGLRVVHAVAVVGILIGVHASFRRAAASRAAAALATAVFACLAWYRLFQLRPDLVTIPATLVLGALLFAREERPGARRVGAALLLLLVWANAHSLFAVGLALILAALLGVGLERALARLLTSAERAQLGPRPAAAPLAAALGLGIAVTALNPRGLAQHATFFVESSSGDIWLLLDDFLRFDPLAPPPGNLAITPLAWLLTNLLLAVCALVAARGLVTVVRRRTAQAVRELDALHLGLAAASAVAMVVAARFLWLSIFPLLYLLRAEARTEATRPAARSSAAWASAAACAALLVAFPKAVRLDAFALEVASEPDGYWRSPWLDDRYCGPGMRFLRDAGLRGNLFQPFNLGGFLGYWLAPDLRTFIDGRLDHVPSEVLQDYLAIRRASQRGVPEALRRLLEKWHVDVFVGLDFPEERYADAGWIAHLRRFPAWIPVFATEHCAIYLHRVAGAEENLLRVRAYYAQRRLPFDGERGIDASELVRRRPAWAHRQRMLPPDFEELEARQRDPDPGVRAAALDRLGELFWRVGAFREGERVDRELLELRPEAREPRRRLADDLLMLGRPTEALEVAVVLWDEDPDYGDIHAIHQIALNRVRGDEAAAPAPDASGAEP